MICICRRISRSSRCDIARRFLPSKKTSPPVGSISRKIARPKVDLPQPDSQTQRFAFFNRKIDAVDSFHRALVAREQRLSNWKMLFEISDF